MNCSCSELQSKETDMRVFVPNYRTAASPATASQWRVLRVAVALSIVLLNALLGHGQTSELYLLYSPNVIDPVGTTSVYQGGHLLRSWGHVGPYEIALAAVGGTVRQGAVDAEDYLRRTIEKRPYTVALVALGIGWLLGRRGRVF